MKKKSIVRDNILFELGLFIGSLGKERCFILKPRGDDLHFPTDLAGITPADYEPSRSDNDLASAVNHSCVLIKNQIKNFGLNKNTAPSAQIKNENLDLGSVTEKDKLILRELLSTATESPGGYALHVIKNNLRGVNGVKRLN